MIIDYPPIYENELFYVYLLRYHKFSGKLHLKDSFADFTSCKSNMEEVCFPRFLKEYLQEFHINKEAYFEEHSILPFYRSFLPNEEYENAIDCMVNSKKICKFKVHKNTSIKIDSASLYYCPICHENVGKTYKSVAIYQQVPIVHVCAEHKCFLKKIFVYDEELMLKPSDWNITPCFCENEISWELAEDTETLFLKKTKLTAENITPKIREKLLKEGSYNNRLWQKRLEEQNANFRQEYPHFYSSLLRLEAVFKLGQPFSETPFINFPVLRPIEYLILIRFLYGSVQKFLNE